MADIDARKAVVAPGRLEALASNQLARTILLSLGGESVQSAFHFALGILLIRALVPHDYGLYSVIFNLGGIALTYGNALMTVPSTVYFAHAKSPGAARFIECAFGSVALAASALIALVVVAVLAAFEAPLWVIPPASVFVGGWTLRNHLRLMAYASGHPFVATVSDAVFSSTGLISIAILLVLTRGEPHLPVLLWLLAGANVVACLAAVVQRGAPLRISLRRSIRTYYLKTWRDIAWSLFGVTTWNIQGQALTFLVAATHGVTAFAPIAAGIVLFRPYNTMATAAINVLRPRLATDMARGRQQTARRTLITSLSVTLVASAVYCLALWLAWPLLKSHVFAGRYPAGTMETIVPLVAITMTIAISYHVPMSVLQAGRNFRSFALATTLGGTVGVAAISTLLLVSDSNWSLLGVILGEAVCFAVLWSAALRLLLKAPEAAVPPDPIALASSMANDARDGEAPGVRTAIGVGDLATARRKSLLVVRINRARDTAWVEALVARLASRGDVGRVVVVAGAPAPLPSALASLLAFERHVLRAPGHRSGPGFEITSQLPTSCDLALDLTASDPAPVKGAARTFCPLFDGVADDANVYLRLLDGASPTIEIVDVGSGRVQARGTPGAESHSTLSDTAAFILARVATLVEAALDRSADLGPPMLPAAAGAGRGRIATAVARRLAFAATGRLYRLCYNAPHWRVGWRLNDGPGVLERGDLVGPSWRVLAGPVSHFYADPFPIWHQGRGYIFVEDYDHRTGKGIISYAEIGADGTCGPVRPALEVPWHLSYPFLFEDGGEIYMIPESCSARHVALYRAERFPDRWVCEGYLLDDIDLSDATILRHQGRLWMFGAGYDGAGSRTDLLSIYSSDKLLGPWVPHALNPVLVDNRLARPAGSFVERDGRLWRVTQDCSRGYGSALAIAEVIRLDDTDFEQRLHAVVHPNSMWPGRRLHTLNRAGRLECIDGSAHSPKIPLLPR